MFIKKTSKVVKGKTYTNHLLVESVATAKGPRHRVVCSLGSLAPAPRKDWLALAHKIEQALSGQSSFLPDPTVTAIVDRIRTQEPVQTKGLPESDLVCIDTDKVQLAEAREAGPVHVGHQMWKQLNVDHVLQSVGFDERAGLLTEVMTLNRLICPTSEHAMPDWIGRSALGDILGTDASILDDETLYRHLDRLHPQREKIERSLAERERSLFNLEESIFLYDLTSTYFEGKCPRNPQAQRGYSRDQRPDCKQVVVGLVIDPDGFPKAHEVFDGNRVDTQTLDEMLDALEKRVGRKPDSTVVVDRGMAYADNLQSIKARGYHYIVACRQSERDQHWDEFAAQGGWKEIVREVSPSNPLQKKSRVCVRQQWVGEETHVLCISDGRKQKDRAIREKHEQRLLKELDQLRRRCGKGRVTATQVHEAIGRLKERYPRVARYYDLQYDPATHALSWTERVEKKTQDQKLDGAYLLKTDRQDLTDEQIWRTYILLTRVENAFRNMKSPLAERPIFHHRTDRVQAHIFLCVLAYHLLVAIEKRFLDRHWHTSWATLRQQLSTHQVATVLLPASNGEVLSIRRATNPEPIHTEIYQVLGIPQEVIKPVKTWHAHSH